VSMDCWASFHRHSMWTSAGKHAAKASKTKPRPFRSRANPMIPAAASAISAMLKPEGLVRVSMAHSKERRAARPNPGFSVRAIKSANPKVMPSALSPIRAS